MEKSSKLGIWLRVKSKKVSGGSKTMLKLKLIWEDLFRFIMCKRKKNEVQSGGGGKRKPDAHEACFRY